MNSEKPTINDAAPTFEPEELERYQRHLALPQVGIAGQEKLKAASVLIVGAGGLAAPVGMYLAAAGLGTIGIVDFDDVDLSNLHRQVMFGTDDVGQPKTRAAKTRLANINPHVEVHTHNTRLSSANAFEIVRPYDLVVDCTDNFATRYLVNDTCVLLGIPFVYGSIFQFDGQVSVLAYADGPCYRCLYPRPPVAGSVPDCAEGGVLGVLPGIVGSIQANEAIKMIIGIGTPLRGRLFMFDALQLVSREMQFQRDPDCPACGTEPTITNLIDYEKFCATSNNEGRNPVSVPEISATDLKQKLDAGEEVFILDCREPHEYEICNIGGVLIPMGDITARMLELDASKEIVVHCRTGMRSAEVVMFLQNQGFGNVWNLRGGIHAWSDEVDSSIPKY